MDNHSADVVHPFGGRNPGFSTTTNRAVNETVQSEPVNQDEEFFDEKRETIVLFFS